jgi:hypothetical protein
MSLNPTLIATHPSPELGLAIVVLIVVETAVAVEGVPVGAADGVVGGRVAAVVVVTAAMAAQGTRRNRQITGAAMKIAAS